MKPKSKKEILAKLMQKVPIIQEHTLKIDCFVRQQILQSPIYVTQMMVSKQSKTIPDTSTIHQLVLFYQQLNQRLLISQLNIQQYQYIYQSLLFFFGQSIPGFKVNNQFTYKLHGNSGRKNKDKSGSIAKFQTQPSFSLNSTISKIYLSPRPTNQMKYKKYAKLSHTFRKNIPHRALILRSNNQDSYNHKRTYQNFDRWDTYDDKHESKSFIF